MSINDLNLSEYEALRATITERGTLRIGAVLGGFVAWGALATALLVTQLQGAVTLAPLLVLAATFEVNFFVHTGVERIGRYIQVFHEEAQGSVGWETTAMRYGRMFPTRGGLDPLFTVVFLLGAGINASSSLETASGRPGWMALSLIAHLGFAYRLAAARKAAGAQRALDLDRFRSLLSK